MAGSGTAVGILSGGAGEPVIEEVSVTTGKLVVEASPTPIVFASPTKLPPSPQSPNAAAAPTQAF